MSAIRMFLGALGVLLGLLALAAYGLSWTAMAAVLDMPFITTVLAGGAVLCLLLGLGTGNRTFRVLLLLAALAVGALSAHQRFLSYEAVPFAFGNESLRLSGTLYLPAAEGPHPAAVFVHGSGPETRKEYAYYAKYLARHGIAGVVYDKRGTGESLGELYGTDYHGYAADAAAAIAKLREREDIRENAIGLVGFSEGEWVVPLAARMAQVIDFVAVVGASGLSPAQQVNAEIGIRLRSMGYVEDEVARAVALNQQFFDYLLSGRGVESLERALAQAADEPWLHDAEDIPLEVPDREDYAWWRSVMDFDAAAAWRDVHAPVLILKGAYDDRSRPGEARQEIETALQQGHNPSFRFVVFPGADHMLLKWPLGEGVPPPLFAPGFPRILADWIGDQTGDGNP